MAKTNKRPIAKPVVKRSAPKQAGQPTREPPQRRTVMATERDPDDDEATLSEPQQPGPVVKQTSPPPSGKTTTEAEARANEWLREAREIRDLDSRGDAASPPTIKRLMFDAIPVVEALIAYEPPVGNLRARGKESDD